MVEHRVDDGGIEHEPTGREPAPDAAESGRDGRALSALVALDEDGQATVTLFPTDADEAELVTTWLTADIEAVVDLESMR